METGELKVGGRRTGVLFPPESLLYFLTVNFGTLQCDRLCETIKKKGKLSKGKVGGGGLVDKSCPPLVSPGL